MSFTFVDLFAGIGGFHAALGAMGGNCVYASEIDKDAARIYQRNWGLKPDGDITLAANDETMLVPAHDVLVGGFPCQPFSKSGKQQGMEETRGTLFWNIAKIVEIHRPTIVLLENVRNIVGPRHIHEWGVITATLRQLGYRVSDEPMIVSPHLIRPEFGGRPQVRDRVFIAATRIPKGMRDHFGDPGIPSLESVMKNWDHQDWNLERDLPLDKIRSSKDKSEVALGEAETRWIEAWNEFVEIMRERLNGASLPGFPIWADDWIEINELQIPAETPAWKSNFLRKNAEFYTEHRQVLDKWLKRWNNLSDFPPSRRKLEWQAQDATNLWDTVMHFRPSGIRAKRATYLPALVAITQTSIVGKFRRRISPREAARLQGLPDWFDFVDQPTSMTYKQLGNGVNVGAVYNVIRAQVLRDIDLLSEYPDLVRAILGAPPNPDLILGTHSEFHKSSHATENLALDFEEPLRLVK
jgi:DNA (cytosine-5)-methyltransferase 1